MAGFLFRRDPGRAPYQPMGSSTPLDGPAIPDQVGLSLPDQLRSPLCAAVAAYALLVSPTPPDAGFTPIAPAVTASVPSAARAACTAYNFTTTPSPMDSGKVAFPAVCPDQAPAYPYRSAAYRLIQP